MGQEHATRASTLREFENHAELLVVHQLDLLAQIEAQLRAVHHTMGRIQRLRSAKLRIGAELSDQQRETTLAGLSSEVDAIDAQIHEEHSCCLWMQQTIEQMHGRLVAMKRAAAILDKAADSSAARGEPPDKT